MKRYLVTGGTGFIGSAIVKRLASQKLFVRVLDNEFRTTSQTSTHLSNVEYIKGDIRKLDDVENACKDIDCIIHLAYINGTKFFYEKPELVLEVGVKGMLNVLDGAKKHKVKELFLASSSEVYQDPPIIPTPENVPMIIPDLHNPRYSYGGGKIISELLSLYLGSTIFKRVVIFRPHNVYGPNMGHEHVIPELILKILNLKKQNTHNIMLPIQGDGTNTRAFIYIDDFVDALMVLLKKGTNKDVYNIGTSDEYSVKELLSLLEKVTNTDITVVNTPSPSGSAQRRCPDVEKITALGFNPKTSLLEGLKKTYLWYNNDLQ